MNMGRMAQKQLRHQYASACQRERQDRVERLEQAAAETADRLTIRPAGGERVVLDAGAAASSSPFREPSVKRRHHGMQDCGSGVGVRVVRFSRSGAGDDWAGLPPHRRRFHPRSGLRL
jgi:hypothetical protein